MRKRLYYITNVSFLRPIVSACLELTQLVRVLYIIILYNDMLQILLRDKDAAPAVAPGAVGEAAQCLQLACRTPHRAGFYYAGPALPGTSGGKGKVNLNKFKNS